MVNKIYLRTIDGDIIFKTAYWSVQLMLTANINATLIVQ